MPRKRDDGLLDVLFELLSRGPLWLPFLLAAIVYGGSFAVSQRSDWPTVMTAFAIFFAAAGLIIVVQRSRRRALLDNQKSLETIRSLSWPNFERLVGEAYRRQGYSVEELGGSGPDGGVDLLLLRSGEKVVVQCKRWKNRTVDVRIVREIYGVMVAEGATAAIVVSSGRYTAPAMDFARGKPLTLVDGDALLALIRNVQVDASPATPFNPITPMEPPAAIPTSDRCPNCGGEMVRRTARKGPNAGAEFWGCSQYPQCRGTRAV
ncbi:MAG: restriction endonuclease [Capsulimonas sp.]|uniref:restriction endonuclease n=1 Tax=Capsulimonas sp. TaxID=2494211 RepID=UPI003264B808